MALVEIVAPEDQEGTKSVISKWLKQPGEFVAEGDAVVEIETDKVALEVASPAAGILVEICAQAGMQAPPGLVLGKLRPESEAPAPKDEVRQEKEKPAAPIVATALQTALSPSVRRLVAQEKLDPASIRGTGRGGRLTREDVLKEIERRKSRPAATPGGSRIVPHDNMRRRIAEHMVRSVTVAPHVTAVFEADFTAVLAHRAALKAAGRPAPTVTAYLLLACAAAMKDFPTVNSRWHDDHLEIFDDVNIGVGTALEDKGLIVPVVRRVQDLSLDQAAERLQDLTARARTGKLTPGDVQGGTFSISNHGVSGSLVAAPIIINQPQSAILGVGKLEKRVVVREAGGTDAIQIRPMAFVSLTIDHRVLDGSVANGWMTRFVQMLEQWPQC